MRIVLRLILSVVLLGGPAAAVVFLAGGGAPLEAREPEAPVVRVAPVEASPDALPRRFYGVARATDRALLAFTLGGRVDERPVEVGDVVAEGDVLARLDRSPLRHARAAAEARVEQIEAELDQRRRETRRTARLYEVDAIAQQSHEQARTAEDSLAAALGAAEAEHDEARRRVREGTLRAPFDGTVTEVLVEPDEFVGPGQPVVLLSGEAGVEVEVEVPESLFVRLHTDTPVVVDLPMAGPTGLPARIVHLGTTGAGPGRLFPVVVRLGPTAPGTSTAARPGMTADVVFALDVVDGLSLPIAAVIDPAGDDPAVLSVTNAAGRRVGLPADAIDGDGAFIVERVPVRPGDLVGDRVSVVGDLSLGDLVVIAGHSRLEHGEPVLPLGLDPPDAPSTGSTISAQRLHLSALDGESP